MTDAGFFRVSEKLSFYTRICIALLIYLSNSTAGDANSVALITIDFFLIIILLKTIYNYEEKVNNGIGNKKHQGII